MAELKTKLELALRDAMRSNDDVRKRTLRMILSAIRLAEVEKGNPLDDNSILALLHKEIKSRRETIEDAQKGQRPDLVAAAQAEIKVIQEFLPQALSEEELIAMAKAAIEEVGAKTPADLGKVMKLLIPRLQGRASGDEASRVVRQLLQNQGT
ncbi:GatB/YqeY domain-containing protein [Thermanaerothrix sp. 4228-RoL]|uniref:GatB/YqeY domain-containing protein n=1 Tax=Thermanaerothrix solaris TaxID=3058434 RepID=A0ABU3NJW2_9CHLR|nr:GatB/YqeY domain-containing protein [Thermanaerothrix sp. 4228-RoL]MDT8897087.1 GatB/YqeY domain-containing protein [Thermanaerothrix sp. 4228-RoL]